MSARRSPGWADFSIAGPPTELAAAPPPRAMECPRHDPTQLVLDS